MKIKEISREETRTIDQITEHYEIEKELANKLRIASNEERKELYKALYDELFERVPHHSQLAKKQNKELQKKTVSRQIAYLAKYLNPDFIFIELGAGDCALSFEVSKYVKKVYAIDVSEKITSSSNRPKNFELILSDGISVDVPAERVDVAYSSHLMEHLHPDDALEQLQNIYRALVPGGIYMCSTPHRFMGPADISGYFDEVATGFHLKEYTYKELNKLFKSVGFKKVKSFNYVKGLRFKLPITLVIFFELLLSPFPRSLRKIISKKPLIKHILLIQLIATK